MTLVIMQSRKPTAFCRLYECLMTWRGRDCHGLVEAVRILLLPFYGVNNLWVCLSAWE